MIGIVGAICAGASFGALARYFLGVSLNSLFPFVPMGTLVANLSGGYIIGIAIGVFTFFPDIDPKWQLFITTGFLGALTTFSSFSAEVVTLLLQQRLFWALLVAFLHIVGSLCMTFLGIYSFTIIRRFFLS